MARRRGLTLLEVLTVLAIVSVLTALLLPVMASVRESAYQRSCHSNLRQIHLATALYRSAHDGDGKYGRATEMGLPPLNPRGHQTTLGVPSLRCARWPAPGPVQNNWSYQFTFYETSLPGLRNPWEPHVEEFREDALIAFDTNHNPPNHPMASDYVSHLGLGVTLGGTLLRLHKPGDPDRFRWWTTTCSTSCAP